MWMVNYAAPGVAIAGLGVTYYALMRKDLDLDRQNHQDYVAYILEILEKTKEDGDPNGCGGVSPNEGGVLSKSRSSECFTASKFQVISLNEELRLQLQQHSKHSIRSRSLMPVKRRPLTTSTSVPLTPPSNIISSSAKLLTELSRSRTRKPLSASDTNLKTKNETTTQRLRRNQDVLNGVTCTDTNFTNLSQLVTGDAEIKIDNAVNASNSTLNFSKIFTFSNSNTVVDSISINGSASTRTFEATKIFDSEIENVSSTSTSSHSSDSLAISLSPSESISQNFENDIVTMQDTDINIKENECSNVQYFDRLEFQSSDIFACKQEKHKDNSNLSNSIVRKTNLKDNESATKVNVDGVKVGVTADDDITSSSSDVDTSDCESVVKNESVITVIRSSSPVSCYFSNPRYGQRFACRNSDQLANANATGDIKHHCKNREKDKCTSKSTSRSVIDFKKIRNSGAILSLSDPTFERHDQETSTLTTSGTNENDEMNYDGSLYANFNDAPSVSRRVTQDTQQRPRASKINMKLKQHSDPIVQGYSGTGACCHSACGHRDSTQFLLPPVLSDSIMSTCVEDPVGKLEDINSFGSAGTGTGNQQPYSKSFDYLHLHELAVEHILKDHNERLSYAVKLVDRIQSLPDILQRDNRYGSVPSWINMNTHNRSVLVPNTWLNWKSVKVFLCSKGFSLKIFDGFEINTSASLFKIGILVVTTLTVIAFLIYYLITILNPPELEPPPPVQLSSWHW